MTLISPITASRIAPIQFDILQANTKAGGTTATDSSQFGNALDRAVETVNTQQVNADQLAQQAATGQLQNVQDYMVASTEAQLTTQLMVTLRNKAVDAFNEIMRMQV